MNKSFADLHRWHRAFIIPLLILICLIIQLTNSIVELFFWTNTRHNTFFDEFFKISIMFGGQFTITIICPGLQVGWIY